MKRWMICLALITSVPALSACATGSLGNAALPGHPEAALFDANADADRQLEDALLKARLEDRLTLAVFGANWCHDSRAMAGWLETPRFMALTDAHYEVVFIDVGTPQTGKGRNLELAEMAGVTDIEGTPTVLVYGSDGTLLNADTAKGWRNAASRSEDAIYDELAAYAAAQE